MLILHAPNVHQGGGQILLLPVLEALKPPARVHLDARLGFEIELSGGIEVRRFQPSLAGRLGAERVLRAVAGPEDVVVCFGNLPPLFRCSARTIVLVQNRYLLQRDGLQHLPYRTRLRLQIERAWLRLCVRGSEIVVQTPTMARAVDGALRRTSAVHPFARQGSSSRQNTQDSGAKQFDFLYVASCEPHKNHGTLLAAWQLLHSEGTAPSLGLTLPKRIPSDLRFQLSALEKAGAPITCLGPRPPDQMVDLYRKARALIYPSLFESFGLPLLEARDAGLPIVAAERDYVRDIVVPQETFDPVSAVSIARAVRRFCGREEDLTKVTDAKEFLVRIGAQV